MRPKTLMAAGLCAGLATTGAMLPSGETAPALPSAIEVTAGNESLVPLEDSQLANSLFPFEQQPVEAGSSDAAASGPGAVEPTTTTIAKQAAHNIPGKLYILGDSLTEGMQLQPEGSRLQDQLALHGWGDVLIRAACGRPLIGDTQYRSCDTGHPMESTPFPQINEQQDRQQIMTASAVLIELGTNDFYRTPQEFEVAAKNLVREVFKLNRFTEIFWLNTYVPGRGNSYRGINQAISRVGVEVIDMADDAAPYYRLRGCPDGIHPCDGGYKMMIGKIIQALGPTKSPR